MGADGSKFDNGVAEAKRKGMLKNKWLPFVEAHAIVHTDGRYRYDHCFFEPTCAFCTVDSYASLSVCP